MSFRDKPTLNVTRLMLDAEQIASSMGVSVASAFKVMLDGRAVSPWAKHWVAKVYQVPIDQRNEEHETGALSGVFGNMGHIRAAIRVLADGGIRFQRNKRIGVGRSCSQEDLIEDLGKFDRQIVVSINKFPEIIIYPLDAKVLLSGAMDGSLTPSGISSKNFVGWVSERHRIEYHNA